MESEPCRRKSPVALHAGKRDRLLSRLASRTSEPIFFFRTTIPSGLCARGRASSSDGSPLYPWVPQQLPEPEPPRSRGTGAAGVRTGVAMVTRARLRWGRAKGGSTCRYSRLGGILTSRPCCSAMVWAGRGLSGLGSIQRPAKEATGGGSGRECVLGLSRLGGAFEDQVPGDRAVREGDIRDGWRVLKQGNSSRGRISEAGRRNWRWGGGVPSGGLSGVRQESWRRMGDVGRGGSLGAGS